MGSTHSPLGWGPLKVRDARTGTLLRTIDGRPEGWDGQKRHLLVRVHGSYLEVYTSTMLEKIARIGPARSAALSDDGHFVFHRGTDTLQITRLLDGAVLFQVPPDQEGQRGLSYTADGLFDGGPEALQRVTFRTAVDVRKGRIVGLSEVPSARTRPGLAAAFFAGRRLETSAP